MEKITSAQRHFALVGTEDSRKSFASGASYDQRPTRQFSTGTGICFTSVSPG